MKSEKKFCSLPVACKPQNLATIIVKNVVIARVQEFQKNIAGGEE